MTLAPRSSLVVALLVGAALAGCVQPPSEETPADKPQVDLTKPFVWTYNATACRESDLVLLVDKAKLQGQLPDGFRVADASKLFALPIPTNTGRGAILATAYACTESENDLNETIGEGQLTILVEKPNVEGERAESVIDFYELGRYVPNGTQANVLDALGWEHWHGTVEATMTARGGSGEVSGANGTDYAFAVTTPGSGELSGIARFWHDLEDGIAHADYVLETPVDQLLGTATCTIASGSPLHAMSGITSCTAENSLGSGFATLSPRVEFHYAPGVHATT